MEPLRIVCGIANCYLLKGEGKSILVDAGPPGCEKKLEKALARYGVHPRDLSLVLLTHGHADHTGAAEALRAAYGVPVAMHPADENDCAATAMTGQGAFGKLLLFVSKRATKPVPPPKPDVRLQEGTRLDEYGVPGAVVALPGHTAGSVGVLLDDGHLLCGDMFMNFIGPHTAHMAEDFALLPGSVAKLRGLCVQTVWPGHGKAFGFEKMAAEQPDVL